MLWTTMTAAIGGFNNLLAAVMGSLQLIRRKSDDPLRVQMLADSGLEAAQRGANLIGQLLAFSRAQRLRLEPLRVSALISDMRDLLSSTVGHRSCLERHANLSLVFVSGYSETAVIEAAVGNEVALLRKPFTIDELQGVVAASLP